MRDMLIGLLAHKIGKKLYESNIGEYQDYDAMDQFIGTYNRVLTHLKNGTRQENLSIELAADARAAGFDVGGVMSMRMFRKLADMGF